MIGDDEDICERCIDCDQYVDECICEGYDDEYTYDGEYGPYDGEEDIYDGEEDI